MAEPGVWLSSAHPCAAQLATAASRRRCRSSAGMPPRRVRRATISPITAAARIPSTAQTQVGVVFDELELVVVPVVGAVTSCVVVCSTVVATVVAGAVVVSSTVVVTGSVSVVVTSATPTAVTLPASSRPAAKSAPRPTSFATTATQTAASDPGVIQPG
jgi:hypothetical protein